MVFVNFLIVSFVLKIVFVIMMKYLYEIVFIVWF